MTLEQLNAFDAVVKHGTIRSASIQLQKTPATISLSIKSLEDKLGIVLFLRSAHRLTLSPAGVDVYKKVSVILQSINEVKTVANAIRSTKERNYKNSSVLD